MAKATKDDLVKALVKLGYDKKELTKLSLKDLEEMMTKESMEDDSEEESTEAEETESDEESDEEMADDEDEEEEVAAKGDELDIVKGEGESKEYVRTYSKKVHGAEYKDLAKQFCEKNSKCSIAKKPVTALVVKWREFDKKANAGEGAQVEKTERFTKKQDALLFAQKDGKVRKVVLVVEPKK